MKKIAKYSRRQTKQGVNNNINDFPKSHFRPLKITAKLDHINLLRRRKLALSKNKNRIFAVFGRNLYNDFPHILEATLNTIFSDFSYSQIKN